MAAIYDDLQTLASPQHEIHANGAAVLSSPLWLQIITDVLGHQLDSVDAEAEASARGAAVCALHSLGAIDLLGDLDHTVSQSYHPDPATHAIYRRARDRQSRLENAMNVLTGTT
jgi:sugar (pentulose or hexulose) kinase